MFKIAVGKKEARSPRKMTATVIGRWELMPAFLVSVLPPMNSGTRATNQGSSKGRLLALAPVSRAAASMEYHRSEGRRENHPRQAKSTAARAKTVENVPFPA